ncbi:MAG: DUF368 domain-containing protein [Bacteroidales bacterium]|nr:DUF368 domain-containing protein [Bacteroidales bacterium]
MGAADVIPGVSGGTIAFLTGIYETLINSIRSVDATALKLFFTLRWKEFWKHINGNFLLSLAVGILISVVSIAKVMTYLMEHHPIPLWSFFFGLIIASAVYILRDIQQWKASNLLSLLVGAGIGAAICLMTPGQTPTDLWFIFLSGAIAICAMILPGISGSFILLLMGKYEYILAAVNDLNVAVLIVFLAGAAVGIVCFSHFLSWLLKHFYTIAICVLSGFMIGSLVKIWPWQDIQASGVSFPTLPGEHIGLAVLFAAIGISIVFIIEYFAKRMENKK